MKTPMDTLSTMGYERFTKRGRTCVPAVTINKAGAIGINRPAVEQYKLVAATHVVLMYSPKQRQFAIVAAKPGDTGAARLRHRKKGGGADVSATTFLRTYNIPHGRCAFAENSRELGIIICEVKK